MQDRIVLYVEDNFHNRRIVNKVLTSQGYKILEALDGESGLELIRQTRPPLILLDITLPGMDGLEVIQHLKSDQTLKNIPVIALTASAMHGDRERFLQAGCDDYLSKPIQVHELIEMVAKYFPAQASDHVSSEPIKA